MGTHEELMASDGLYRHLNEVQLDWNHAGERCSSVAAVDGRSIGLECFYAKMGANTQRTQRGFAPTHIECLEGRWG